MKRKQSSAKPNNNTNNVGTPGGSQGLIIDDDFQTGYDYGEGQPD
jgi:hypothetical protein